ncbi:MAG: hypothetical protein L0H41_17975, partial [Microlunatus sp.]|nr:hypothetical protein [Microlunatus sp.]
MESEEVLVAGPDGRALGEAATRARVLELAGLFEACRLAFFETADRFHWQPAPGSPAELVATVLPSPRSPLMGSALVSRSITL